MKIACLPTGFSLSCSSSFDGLIFSERFLIRNDFGITADIRPLTASELKILANRVNDYYLVFCFTFSLKIKWYWSLCFWYYMWENIMIYCRSRSTSNAIHMKVHKLYRTRHWLRRWRGRALNDCAPLPPNLLALSAQLRIGSSARLSSAGERESGWTPMTTESTEKGIT